MRTIHIAEHCHEGLNELQQTMMELRWQPVRVDTPYRSPSARTQWALNAQEWLSSNCEDGWTGIAYLEDGFVQLRFQAASDATAFQTACASEGF